MLWFNEQKQVGKIEADDGRRFSVEGSEFVLGHPVGRCANLSVVFYAVGDHALRVEPVTVPDARRARRRSL
jgi:hypothetical protein